MRYIFSISIVALSLLWGYDAFAHSFDAIIVVPVSGPHLEAGKQARDGIQFAARERDGHPNETADGHLGGLDVYLRVVDSAAGEDRVVARLRELVARSADDTPWVIAPAGLVAVIERQVNGTDIATIDLSGGVPLDIRTMDGGPFNTAFEKMFGYPPTAAVRAGYGAARQIDKTVRGRN